MLVASFRSLLDKIIAGYPFNYQHQPIYVHPYYCNQFEYRHLNHFTPSHCFGCEYAHNQTRYNFHYPPHISSPGNPHKSRTHLVSGKISQIGWSPISSHMISWPILTFMNFPFGDTDLTTTSSILPFNRIRINLPISFLVTSLSLFIFPPSGNGGSPPLPIAHPQTASQKTCPSGVSSQLNPHITAPAKSIILTPVSQYSGL